MHNLSSTLAEKEFIFRLIRCAQIISMADPEDHWLEPIDLFLKNICKIAIKKRLNWTPNSLERTLNNFSLICPFSEKYSMKYSLGRNLKLISILKDGEMCKWVGMIRAEIGLKNRQIINETYSFRCFLIL